jgi:hypothetical protein
MSKSASISWARHAITLGPEFQIILVPDDPIVRQGLVRECASKFDMIAKPRVIVESVPMSYIFADLELGDLD